MRFKISTVETSRPDEVREAYPRLAEFDIDENGFIEIDSIEKLMELIETIGYKIIVSCDGMYWDYAEIEIYDGYRE